MLSVPLCEDGNIVGWPDFAHCSASQKPLWNWAVHAGIRRVVSVIAFEPNVTDWYLNEEKVINKYEWQIFIILRTR